MPKTNTLSQTPAAPSGSAAEIAYTHIREAIVTGRLAPGELLKEASLADEIGISRTPVREALNRLASEGLVELERFRRGRVAQFSAADAVEIFTLRALIEGHGAGRAASRIGPDVIAKLITIEEELEARFAELGWHRHLSVFDRLNNEFHGLIAAAAESPRLERILASSLELPGSIFNHYSEVLEERTRRTHRQHREIIDALKAGNSSWAEAAMRGHLMSLAPLGDEHSLSRAQRSDPAA
jgi:DNA-binding GntR family transcriptional regulator